MKKTFKRAGVAVLSMAMLLSMGAVGATSASAVANSSAKAVKYTISAPEVTNGTYSVYRVLTATVNGEAYDYTYAAGFGSSNTPASGVPTIAQLSSETTDTTNRNTATNRAITVKKYASDIASVAKKATPLSFETTGYTESTDTGAVTSIPSGTEIKLVPGYYLIVPNTGNANVIGAPTLVSITNSDEDDLTGKVDVISIDKKIAKVDNKDRAADGAVSATGSTAVAGENQKVTYTIATTVPMYDPDVTALTNDFYIKDTASAGLTLPTTFDNDVSTDAITVEVNNAVVSGTTGETDATTNVYKVEASAGTFTLTFNDAFTVAHGGETVLVTYTGTVNSSATTYNANTNTAEVGFDNDYATGNGTAVKKQDQTTFYNAKLKIFKEKPDHTKLTGAFFTVTKSDGTYLTAGGANGQEVDSDGFLTFQRIPADTYTITEVKAPSGYRIDSTPRTVTITNTQSAGEYTNVFTNRANNIDVTVTNTKGEELPGTGGIGTTLFTVGGAAIVLLAGAMFVVFMRKRNTEE